MEHAVQYLIELEKITYFKEAVLLCSESSFAQRHGTPRFDFADLLRNRLN